MVDISTKIENDVFEIMVDGDIDASSSIYLDNALEEGFATQKVILINMEHLNYISSAGLGVFIARLEEIRDKGLSMILFGLNDKVKNVFNILGLEVLLNIKPDKKSALESIES